MLHVGDVSVSAIVAARALDVAPSGRARCRSRAVRSPEVASEAVLELAVEPAGFRDLLAGVRGAVAVKGPPTGVSILDGGSALLDASG